MKYDFLVLGADGTLRGVEDLRERCAGKGGFQQAGFHPTGVVGTLGCTLLASCLWKMNIEQMVLAQGIALSTAVTRATAEALHHWNPQTWIDNHGTPNQYYFAPFAAPAASPSGG